MKKFYKKSSRRPRSRKAVIRKALKKDWSRKVSGVVKRVLSRNIETKMVNEYYTVAPYPTQASIANIAAQNIIMLSPNSAEMPIPVGVASNERIGNKIKTKRVILRMIMYPKPYNNIINPTPKPQVVTIWCCSAKQGYVSTNSMATIFDTNFFNDGGTSSGYLSTLVDSISTVNSGAVQLHWKRTFKLGHSTHYAQPNQASEPYPSNVQYANNDYKMNIIRTFDVTKHIPKNIEFDDLNNTPNVRNTFLIIGVANADGQAFASADHRPLDVYAHLQYQYTDA